MNDKKYTITRSFARKITDGNYGSLDYYSSHSEEIDADMDDEFIHERSMELYSRAFNEVQEALGIEKGFNVEKVEHIIKSINEREPLNVDMFESLTPDEQRIVKQANNAFKRSPEFKGGQITRKTCRACGGKLTARENLTGDTCTECRNSAGGMKKY